MRVSLQAKGKERQWLRHQSTGELDDAKIIDGLTGEKAIYKRRGELEPQVSHGEPVTPGCSARPSRETVLSQSGCPFKTP